MTRQPPLCFEGGWDADGQTDRGVPIIFALYPYAMSFPQTEGTKTSFAR
jgi:hypothetical protein